MRPIVNLCDQWKVAEYVTGGKSPQGKRLTLYKFSDGSILAKIKTPTSARKILDFRLFRDWNEFNDWYKSVETVEKIIALNKGEVS